MTDFATSTLFTTSLVLPLLLFLVANSFPRPLVTLARAALAIAGGWAFALSYAIAASAIAFAGPHSQAQLAAMYDADGAPLAFAAVLGWVPSALLVSLAWAARSLVAKRGSARPNNSSKPTPLRGAA